MKRDLQPSLPLLLVDDEETWVNRLALTLKRSGGFNNILRCVDSREVVKILSSQGVSVVLLDLSMPHRSGEELLATLCEEYPAVPVIVLSGLNQVDTAVGCLHAGAFDYFVKSVEVERLIAGIRRALTVAELRRENGSLSAQVLSDTLSKPENFAEILTRSKKMHGIFQYIEAVAQSREPVLITGESGVGKELIARALHRASRPQGPLVAVNVAGLDDNVFADTLFGHTRGAFTGAEKRRPGLVEEASSGILFLDEIGDLSLASQVKLLRLLQEGEYFPVGSDSPKRAEMRVVCATNQDLAGKVADGAFRKDLYYRLKAHRIQLPPLRERREDIPLLLEHFLTEAASALGRARPPVPPQLSVVLSNYDFPGNVRELRAIVYNALSQHRDGNLGLGSFYGAIEEPAAPFATASARPGSEVRSCSTIIFPDRLPTLREAADSLIAEALRRVGGYQTRAAALLGITQQALSKRMKSQNL